MVMVPKSKFIKFISIFSRGYCAFASMVIAFGAFLIVESVDHRVRESRHGESVTSYWDVEPALLALGVFFVSYGIAFFCKRLNKE